LLPDADRMLLQTRPLLATVSLRSKELRALSTPGSAGDRSDSTVNRIRGSSPAFLASGYLVWVDPQASLMAAPFDASRLRLTGRSTTILTGVRLETGRMAGQFAASDAGTLVFLPGANASVGPLVWSDGSGRLDTMPMPPADYAGLDVSRDGAHLLATINAADGGRELWVFDVRTGLGTRQLTARARIAEPRWSPDNRTFVFELEGIGVLRGTLDRSGVFDTVARGAFIAPSSFAPDGRSVLATMAVGDSSLLMRLAMSDTSQPSRLAPGRDVWWPAISPDGRWLAYTSDETGQNAIYLEPYPATGQRYRITAEGEAIGIWSPRGDRLYYTSGHRYMVRDVLPGSPPRFGPPRVFVDGLFTDVPGRTCAVSADGRRLLFKQAPAEHVATRIRVITNWPEVIRRARARDAK
jgi:eukaryotic-like serine/threonine-protein kinase